MDDDKLTHVKYIERLLATHYKESLVESRQCFTQVWAEYVDGTLDGGLTCVGVQQGFESPILISLRYGTVLQSSLLNLISFYYDHRTTSFNTQR